MPFSERIRASQKIRHGFIYTSRIGSRAKEVFLDRKNSLYFSATGFWEICIKLSLGKLSLEPGWLEVIRDEMATNAIYWLPAEMSHCAELTKLPFHLRDPFDRMLVAQAIVENMQVLSRDRRLSVSGIIRIWE